MYNRALGMGALHSIPKPANSKLPGQGVKITKKLTVRCYKCKDPRHTSIQCPKDSKRCIYCTSSNHSYQNCPERICNQCFNPGHLSKDCSAGTACMQCYAAGHTAENCMSRPEPCRNTQAQYLKCLICKETGHINCNSPDGTSNFTKLTCFVCGFKGHSADICPQVNRNSKLELFRVHVKEAMQELPDAKHLNFRERRYWDKVEKKAFKNLLKKHKLKKKKKKKKTRDSG
jgi:hypothetical protein